MHLSILLPKKFSAKERKDAERFLCEAGFKKIKGGFYRAASDDVSLTARFEGDPGKDPFWVHCPLESLFFLPREEILMTSEGDGRSHERMYGMAADLAKRVRGFIYDHQLDGVYGPDGTVLEDYEMEGTNRAYGAVLHKGLEKE